MVEKKRKQRDDREQKRGRMKKKGKAGSKKEDNQGRRRRGPGLPNVLRKEIDLLNPTTKVTDSDDDLESERAAADDVYEFEEAFAEEESKKNRRYDAVENYEYELPEDFEDEDIASDDDSVDDNDDEKHSRMLGEITGLPADAFEGKKEKKDIFISEAYPESEYNPSRDILEGDRISIQDLVDPLHGKPGFSKLRKDVNRMERKSISVSLHAPLPRSGQEELERKAAYDISKKDITKWEHIVKENREAPTIYFDEDSDVRFSTVGEIASEFEPRTDFERKIASVVNDKEIVEAHFKDGARLLELNKISAEDVVAQQNNLAKMRSFLFHHEVKSKRIKKIKSKSFRRSHRPKAAVGDVEMDDEAAKELAKKQEFKRAEERLTLKHKNMSKWAKRAIGRGLNVQDEGTRAAIAEQLHQHALLTRKMKSMKDSSDESSEDDSAELSADSDDDGPASILRKAKKKTLEILEGDEELPNSGVLSLPFMVRGLKKKKEAADEEARLALQEYESSLKQMEDKSDEESKRGPVSSGRMVFGNSRRQSTASEDKSNKSKSDNFYGNSDSEEDQDLVGDQEGAPDEGTHSRKDVSFDPNLFREETEIGHDHVFETFKDICKDSAPNTTYEVALFTGTGKKKKKPSSDEQMKERESSVNKDTKAIEPTLEAHDMEEDSAESDSDSGGEMVDGILSSGTRSNYELPSQEELLRRAFAGDDVEEDFVKDKEEVLNEEIPEPDKPVLLPGWGQWTHIQKKKGLPSWMLKEHDDAKKKREEALKKRKDASLEHVIISEKLDKKAEKLHTKTLPYPYTSKEVFEQSIRMPIGPEFNPVTAVGALNRPEVVKRTGVSIKPIKYKDINPHQKTEGHKNRKQKPHNSKGMSKGKAKPKGAVLKAK